MSLNKKLSAVDVLNKILIQKDECVQVTESFEDFISHKFIALESLDQMDDSWKEQHSSSTDNENENVYNNLNDLTTYSN
jgi:hypothetical protein